MADHRSISGALPWYAANTLDETERREIDRHLGECAACRERLADIRRFRDLGAESPTERALEHVAPTLLVEYAEHPEALQEDARQWIEGRLAACATCREAYDSLQQVGAALADEPVTEPVIEAAPPRKGLWDWLGATLLRPAPALAYLLIAAIGLPLLWVMRSPGDPATAVQVVAVTGERAQRDGPAVVEPLTIQLDDRRHPVLVELITDFREDDLLTGGLKFVVELSETGRPTWSETRDPGDFVLREGRGVLLLVLDPRVLDSQKTYRLAIRVQKPGDPLDGQALFVRHLRFGAK